MAEQLETAAIQRVLEGVRGIRGVVTGTGDNVLEQLLSLLKGDWFGAVSGYYSNHRPKSPYAALDDEYKVQDLIYSTVVSFIPDLQYEDPQQKNVGALTHTRVDFSSAKHGLFIEIKLASSIHTMKKVEAEINEDISKYGKQRIFSTLVFFVYCYHYSPPNPRRFELGLTGHHVIDGHPFQTFCIVKT